MDYNEILKEAAGLMGPYCKACPVCNGRACGNCVPGPGSKLPGNTAARNYDKWQEIFVNMDTLNPNANVDTSFELFGKKFSAPVFIAPLGALPLHYGDKYDDITYNRVLINAAANYGICAMTGDGEFPQLIPDAVDEMSKIGGIGIPTIKPWNKEVVFEKLDYVKAHNVFAVAMDVDGAGLPFLKKLSPNAGSKSVDEMREIIDYAGKPFIIKGIMTVKGAEKAVEAGASAIVVSNHGGRVQGCTPATAEVLPAIAKAVKGKIKILGLAIANGLVSLSGSMFAQQQRFFDVFMGVGTAVIGLASVIIGTALFGQISVFGFSISVILGSILYKGCVAAAIRIGLQSTDLKLVTAVLFLLILVLSSRIEKYQGRKRRKERA